MNFSDIHTLNDQYIVKFDSLTRETVKIADGLDFKLDTRFNRQHHAAEKGIVLAVPEDDLIKVGDTVICQYLVIEKKNNVGEDSEGFYQYAQREQIFCVLRDRKILPKIIDEIGIWPMETEQEIIMIDGYILVEPEETEENEYEINAIGMKVLKAERKGRETIATVTHIGNDVTNVEVGDRVKIHKAAQYPLILNGKKYYRVRSNVGLLWKYKKEDEQG